MSKNFTTNSLVLFCFIGFILTLLGRTMRAFAKRILLWRWVWDALKRRRRKKALPPPPAEADVNLPASDGKLQFAVIIDSENISRETIAEVFSQVKKVGIAPVRRAYGDWSMDGLKSWKHVLNQYSILPIHQFRQKSRKSLSDSIIIVDALDLLYTQPQLDGFCIVSSDRDFIPLMSRIRREGRIVYAFGAQPCKEMIDACDKYIHLQVPNRVPIVQGKRYLSYDFQRDKKLVGYLYGAYEDSCNDQGWSELGKLRTKLVEHFPTFNQRVYGYAKFSNFVKATKLFEIKLLQKQMWVRKPIEHEPMSEFIDIDMQSFEFEIID